MASRFASFGRDRRGTTFEGIALSVAIVAVAFVASADMLDYLVKKHADRSEVAAVPTRSSSLASSGALDMSPTASVPKMITRSVLDPCTGAAK